MDSKPPTLKLVKITNNFFRTCLRGYPVSHGCRVDQTTNDAEWERWNIIEIEPNKYALRSYHKRWLRGNPNKTVDTPINLEDWELWTIQKLDHGSYTFKSHHGTYLSFDLDRNNVTLVDTCSPMEEFEIKIVE